jgi:uncharacterized protein YecE (DUF72 family)
MARPHVGLASLEGDLERYAHKFDLVELRPVDAPVPKGPTLRAWRRKVPPAFVFSVVLPKAVGELRPSPELDKALEQALAVARDVEARCLVIATPASITPTDLNRKRLAALVARIPHDAVTLAWEPRGLWDTEEAAEVAAKLGITLVVDAAREPAPKGPFAYFRLRGLGEATRLSPANIEKVASELQGRRESYVIIETAGAALVAETLRKKGSRRPLLNKVSGGAVLKPRATLRAEDEEQ